MSDDLETPHTAAITRLGVWTDLLEQLLYDQETGGTIELEVALLGRRQPTGWLAMIGDIEPQPCRFRLSTARPESLNKGIAVGPWIENLDRLEWEAVEDSPLIVGAVFLAGIPSVPILSQEFTEPFDLTSGLEMRAGAITFEIVHLADIT